LQAVHWGTASRGLPATEMAIGALKRFAIFKKVSEGQISVVAKRGSFVDDLGIQSKKQSKLGDTDWLFAHMPLF